MPLILTLISLVPLLLLRGLIIADLWRWFIVPLGLSSIGIIQAMGLATLIAMLTHQSNVTTEKREWWQFILLAVITNLMFWGMGALIHLFL